MKDLRYVRDDGTDIYVSDMPDAEIAACLADGWLEPTIDTSEENVRERLRIEQTIRKLGLR